MLTHNPVVTREEWTNAHRVRAQFAKAWPDCFAGKGKSKRPLKIGIDVDILKAMNLDPREVSLALHDYTNGPTYLAVLVEGAARIGLDGEPCGTVTVEAARHAAGRLKKRIARDTARRARMAEHATAAAACLVVAAVTFLGSAEWARAACMQGPAMSQDALPGVIGIGVAMGAVLTMGVQVLMNGRRL